MLVEFAKASKEKAKGKKESAIYSTGFHSLGGLLAGILFVQLWQLCPIPFNQKIKYSLIDNRPINNPKDTTMDKAFAVLLSTGLMMSELVGVKGGMASGAGFLLGYTMAADYRKGKYIGKV